MAINTKGFRGSRGILLSREMNLKSLVMDVIPRMTSLAVTFLQALYQKQDGVFAGRTAKMKNAAYPNLLGKYLISNKMLILR